MCTAYTLESVVARAEIEDVIHRYCHATDRRRWWLMDSVFPEDATCRLSSIGGSWREFVAQGSALLEPVDATHHQVGNILIAFEGNVAHVETYVTAFHAVPSDAPAGGSFGGTGEAYEVMLGARYIDRFGLRDGRWRIADRRLLTEWRNHRPVREGGLAGVTSQARGSERTVSRDRSSRHGAQTISVEWTSAGLSTVRKSPMLSIASAAPWIGTAGN